MATTQTALLVEASDVIQRMQLDGSLLGVVEVAQGLIRASQLHLQAVLDSNFEKHTYQAVFYIDTEAFSGLQPGGQYRLELPTGCIRTDTPVVVTVGSQWNLSDQAVPPAPGPLFRVDYDRGLVYLQAGIQRPPYTVQSNNVATEQIDWFGEQFVVVNFAAGFVGIAQDQSVSPPNEVTAAEPIPDWLYEAIIAYCPVALNAGQPTNRKDAAKDQYRVSGDVAMSLVSPYNRKKGIAFRPQSWTVTG